MADGRRVRDAMYTKEESNKLLDIVRAHYDVIECKKLDAISCTAKNNVWKKVAAIFNGGSTKERSAFQLRTKYEKMKAKGILLSEGLSGLGGGLCFSGSADIPSVKIGNMPLPTEDDTSFTDAVCSAKEDDGLSKVDGILLGEQTVHVVPFVAVVNTAAPNENRSVARDSSSALLGSNPKPLPSTERRRVSDPSGAQATRPKNEPIHSGNESESSAIELARLELAKLQTILARKAFEAEQRRLDAEEARKVEAHAEWKRQQIAAEERKKAIHELERKILEARLRKEGE